MLLLDVGECVGKVSGPVIFVVFLGEKPKEIFEGLATVKFKSLLIGSKGAVELMILDTTVTIEGLVMVFYGALLVLIVYLDLGFFALFPKEKVRQEGGSRLRTCSRTVSRPREAPMRSSTWSTRTSREGASGTRIASCTLGG